MATLVSILTTPGREKLCQQTITQIESDPLPDDIVKVVWHDGGLKYNTFPSGETWEDERGWLHAGTIERLGNVHGTFRLIEMAFKLRMDLLSFEDDLLLCRNATAAMCAIQIPSTMSFLTFFDCLYTTSLDADVPRIIQRQGGKNWHHAQAFKLSREAIEQLYVASRPNHGFLCTLKIERNGCGRDWVIGRCLHPYNFGIVVPNWVQHIGDESVAWPDRGVGRATFTSQTWQGRGYDALQRPITG